MRTKVTYIISNINKSVSFEWIAELIEPRKIELSFILLNPGVTELENYLKGRGLRVKQISYKNKYDIPKALVVTFLFLCKHKPHILHAHLFDASLVGLSAAWLCRTKKRMYTRHHSTFHHVYFPGVVKFDKLCNYLSTQIIAPTRIVHDVLVKEEGVQKQKIHLIHHGFKLENFAHVPIEEVEQLRKHYSSEGYFPVVGAISRYTEWKGLQYTVPAFAKLLQDFPHAKLILANAKGNYAAQIKHLLQSLPQNSYIEIEFENNLYALYQLFDLFVHVPIDRHSEAFGQTYVESLAASVPAIFTLSGIANDFIQTRHNALIVNYKDSESIYLAMKELLANKTLATTLVENGKKDVQLKFPVSKMISELESLYLDKP